MSVLENTIQLFLLFSPSLFLRPDHSATCEFLMNFKSSYQGIGSNSNLGKADTLFQPVVCLVQVSVLENVISLKRKKRKYLGSQSLSTGFMC